MRTDIMNTTSFTYRNPVTKDVWYGQSMTIRQKWVVNANNKQVTFRIDAIMRPDGHVLFKRLKKAKSAYKPHIYDIVPVARFIEGLGV